MCVLEFLGRFRGLREQRELNHREDGKKKQRETIDLSAKLEQQTLPFSLIVGDTNDLESFRCHRMQEIC